MVGALGLRFRQFTIRLVLATVSAVVLSTAIATAAHAYLYFRNGTAIDRVGLNGKEVRSPFVQTGAGYICGITVTASHIYWTALNDHWIGRAGIDGSHVVGDWIRLRSDACGLTTDSKHLYWRSKDGEIGRADLSGTNVDQNFIKTGAYHPLGAVLVHNGYLFFTTTRGIGRANLDGKDVRQGLLSAQTPTALAAKGDFLYWNNLDLDFHGTTIGRAKLDGTSVDQKFIDLSDVERHPCALAMENERLFYVNWRRGNGGPDSSIHFASLSGKDQPLLFLHKGYNCPSALAADPLGPPPP